MCIKFRKCFDNGQIINEPKVHKVTKVTRYVYHDDEVFVTCISNLYSVILYCKLTKT
jgi:hypothetical protein